MLASALSNGLALGAIYALVGAGLNLIFGVVKIINFAQGALLMVAVYVTYWLVQLTGMDPYLTLPIVVIFMGVFGYLIQLGIINRVLKQERSSQLLITFGISLFLQNSALALWGPNHRSVRSFLGDTTIDIFGGRLSAQSLVAIVGAGVAVALLFYLLNKTRLGTAIRAVAQQPDSAELSGINVKLMFAIAFGIGTATTGFAAVLISPIYDIQPLVGEVFGIMAFIVVVLGGLGNVQGAAVAGLVLGLVQVLFATYISLQMATAFVFAVFLVILFVKPTGLFGRAERVA